MRDDLPKNKVLYLYNKKGLGVEKIAKRYNCSKRTILVRLHKWNAPIKSPGLSPVNLTREKLYKLYVKKSLSAGKIAKITECGRTTVYRRMKFFGIKARDISESHIKYTRKSFTENRFEKAYLLGFTAGDLRVRIVGKNSKTVKIGCGTTRKEQIKLFIELFKKYGHVWLGKPDERGEIQMEAYLDTSFLFLLNAKKQQEEIIKNKKLFAQFLAGFIDADGSFFITNNKGVFSLGNYNYELLKIIRKKLLQYKIKVPKLYPDKKLYVNSEGYKRKKIYWHLFIHRKESLLKLIDLIGSSIKHKKRKLDMQRINANIIKKNEKLKGD